MTVWRPRIIHSAYGVYAAYTAFRVVTGIGCGGLFSLL